MNTTDRLELYRIADELEEFYIDNGPMGEDHPFRDTAAKLRKIARGHRSGAHEPDDDVDTSTGRFIR